MTTTLAVLIFLAVFAGLWLTGEALARDALRRSAREKGWTDVKIQILTYHPGVFTPMRPTHLVSYVDEEGNPHYQEAHASFPAGVDWK